jgi:hypothetical protein
MKPPVLYYAMHQDADKVPLRTVFHPLWLREYLCIDGISERSTYYPSGEYWLAKERRVGPNNQPIFKVTRIDTRFNPGRVDGQYIYNDKQELIASSVILSFQEIDGIYVPKYVRMSWEEESTRINWYLHNTKINITIKPESWKIPDIKKADLMHLPSS